MVPRAPHFGGLEMFGLAVAAAFHLWPSSLRRLAVASGFFREPCIVPSQWLGGPCGAVGEDPGAAGATGGGGAGLLRTGRHVSYPTATPLANLHVSLLNKMGLPVEHLGDSTGTFDELSGV